MIVMGIAALYRHPADDLRLELVLLFEFSVVACACAWLWAANPWWSLFLALAFLSRIIPFYTRASYLAFQAVFYGSVFYGLILHHFRERAVPVLLNLICVIGIVNALYAVVQLADMDWIFRSVAGSLDDPEVGLMGNSNFLSALLAFSFPAFLRPRWRWGLPLVLFGLYLAKTSLGVLSVAGGLVFLAATKRQFYLFYLVPLAALAYVLLIDAPGMERLGVWKNGLKAWLQHPWLGSGIGHWKIVFCKPMVTGTVWKTAHNEFLQMLFEMGIIFPVIVFGYLVRCFRRYRPHCWMSATGLIIVIINSAGNFPFHIAITAMIAILWMAIFDVQVREISTMKKAFELSGEP